jgi:hypothetical protein
MPAQRLKTRGPQEVATLRLAAALTKKVSESAAKACDRAGLDADLARTQAGYAEEAAYVIDKAIGGVVEISHGHRKALLLGLQLIQNELTDQVADQQTFLVETEHTVERQKDVQSLALRIRRYDAPELDDAPTDETTVSVNGGPAQPMGAFDRALQDALHESAARRAEAIFGGTFAESGVAPDASENTVPTDSEGDEGGEIAGTVNHATGSVTFDHAMPDDDGLRHHVTEAENAKPRKRLQHRPAPAKKAAAKKTPTKRGRKP